MMPFSGPYGDEFTSQIEAYIAHAHSPKARALELFQKIATPLEYEELVCRGYVKIVGKYAIYRLMKNGGTYILDEDGEILAHGCLLLEEDVKPFPALDHFIANYLVLKSDERFFWNTAFINARSLKFVNPRKRINQEHGPGRMPRLYR